MITIENLHAQVEGKKILNGIDFDVKPGEVHAIMGPNGSGKSTLSSVIAGHHDYEVTEGTMLLEGEDLSEMSAEERAHKGIFLSFQYPVEIPGVSVTNFIKTAINANRKAHGLENMPANEMLKKIRENKSIDQDASGAVLVIVTTYSFFEFPIERMAIYGPFMGHRWAIDGQCGTIWAIWAICGAIVGHI